ncbi:hypothetical protein BpHYR1_011826 [Brachionus plicatilis]|uniref:Uncharacterized protein n=1 Tax=Brachionus plicatilis TaxID=10195 RepID=A0A3M7RWJ8_BRAPC|nr:hypothetical protein BpHYR1_011826 [Brachionus plicatilis]
MSFITSIGFNHTYVITFPTVLPYLLELMIFLEKIKFLNKKIFEREFNTRQTSTSTSNYSSNTPQASTSTSNYSSKTSSSEYDFGYEYNTCTRMKTRLCFEYKCVQHNTHIDFELKF